MIQLPTLRDVLVNLEEDGLGSIYEGYSGRFMFGDKCIGFVTSDIDSLSYRIKSNGFHPGSIDSMGLDMIMYWPGIKE